MNEIRFYLSLFLRRLPAFLLVAALVSAVSIIIATSLPPAYVSRTRLFVEAPQIPANLAPSTVNVSGAERLQLIEQRLLTRANMLDIANRLNVLEDQDEMTADEIVGAMMARTRIRSSSGRNVASLMQISFEARSPRLAAGVLNEYLKLIQEDDLNFRQARAGQTLDFFEIEVDRLSKELADKSAAILKFKSENANALPDSLDFRQKQRANFQERAESIDREVYELQSQRKQLIAIFESGNMQGELGEASQAQKALAQARGELASSLLLYSETNPKVRLLQSRVAQLEEKVKAEADAAINASGEELPENAEVSNPALQLRLNEIDRRIERLESQRDSAEQRIAVLTENINKTPANDVVLDSLLRDYDNIQKQYNTSVGRLSQASTGERIEVLSRGERLTVIEQPAVPNRPTKPNRMKIAGAGTAMGIALGLALIFLIEFLNKAPRRPEDIIKKMDIWPIAALPYTRTRRELVMQRSRKLALILIILVGGPITVWAVHEFYLPLDLLAEKVMNKMGVRW